MNLNHVVFKIARKRSISVPDGEQCISLNYITLKWTRDEWSTQTIHSSPWRHVRAPRAQGSPQDPEGTAQHLTPRTTSSPWLIPR